MKGLSTQTCKQGFGVSTLPQLDFIQCSYMAMGDNSGTLANIQETKKTTAYNRVVTNLKQVPVRSKTIKQTKTI